MNGKVQTTWGSAAAGVFRLAVGFYFSTVLLLRISLRRFIPRMPPYYSGIIGFRHFARSVFEAKSLVFNWIISFP